MRVAGAGARKATNEGVEEEYLRGRGRLEKETKGVMNIARGI